jgi:fusion and transport protein UGO1
MEVEDDDDDDEEEIEYFQPKNVTNEQFIHTRTQTIKRKPTRPIQKNAEDSKSKSKAKLIAPVSLNTVDMMSSLLSTEGVRGLWRANNASFIFSALSMTFEAWITGFISPFLQIPDPFFVDAIHSPDPTKTLILSISASVITGLILAPLDLIRTKMIVTSVSNNERSIRNSIKNLKFRTCPASLIIPTILNSLTNQFFKRVTPYLLYFKLGIDIYGSPILLNGIKLGSSFLELFVKLPVETLLRRSQVAYLLKPSNDYNPLKISESQLIVKPVEFTGVLSTLYGVYHSRQNGLEGLFRGWRVGTLNIIGTWGLNILQNNYEDQINKTEKF